jgi:hypothetical protein
MELLLYLEDWYLQYRNIKFAFCKNNWLVLIDLIAVSKTTHTR